MVDCLYHSDQKSTRTGFTVTDGNVLAIGGKFTEAGLLENMAQTAAAGAGYFAQQKNEAVRNGFIGAVKNLEIFFLPSIGDQLTTEVIMLEQVFDVNVVSGKIWCNGKMAAQCELKIFLTQ